MSEVLKRVEELLKLPPGKCKQCGLCCTCTSYRGGLNAQQIVELINDSSVSETIREGAKDFLSIFVPYENNGVVKEKFPDVFKMIADAHCEINENEIPLFYCKHYKGGCTNYENRPNLCRVYPTVYKDTKYFPGCGYKEIGERNWREIEQIIESL